MNLELKDLVKKNATIQDRIINKANISEDLTAKLPMIG